MVVLYLIILCLRIIVPQIATNIGRFQQSKPTFEWIRSAQMSISHDQKQIRKYKGHTKNQKSDNERSIEKPTTVHVYSTSQKQCSSTEQLKQLPLENIRGTKLQRITTLVAFSQYLSSTGHDLTLLDDIETMLQETTSGVVVDSWLEPLVDLSSELDEWVTCDFVHHFCFTCPFGCTIGNRRRRCGQR